MKKVIIDGGRGICEYNSREEFIQEMIAANEQDSGEDYNDGRSTKKEGGGKFHTLVFLHLGGMCDRIGHIKQPFYIQKQQ